MTAKCVYCRGDTMVARHAPVCDACARQPRARGWGPCDGQRGAVFALFMAQGTMALAHLLWPSQGFLLGSQIGLMGITLGVYVWMARTR